jgi:nicotinamidase-related amidase
MATTLGAMDPGYRVILVEGTVCSSDDQTCDTSLDSWEIASPFSSS